MIGDRLARWLPSSREHRLLGKVVVLVVLTLVLGYFAGLSDAEDLERARMLTLEQYTSEFAGYKEKLANDSFGMAACIGIVGMALFLLFAVYEVFGGLFGWLLGQWIAPGASADRPLDPTAPPPGPTLRR
jgi:hypothetical protein